MIAGRIDSETVFRLAEDAARKVADGRVKNAHAALRVSLARTFGADWWLPKAADPSTDIGGRKED